MSMCRWRDGMDRQWRESDGCVCRSDGCGERMMGVEDGGVGE